MSDHETHTPPQGGGSERAAEIARRIAAGDRTAEAELVERFSRPLTYMLRRLTRDPDLADDLHQETFRVVLERVRAGALREPEKLGGFVRSTAKNLMIGEYRKRSRRGETGDPEQVETRPDPAPGPLDRTLREEDRRRVRRLLGELPHERDRQVLFRFHLAQEDREAICADLGLTRQQFNLVIFRARRRFQELVLRDGESDPG